ncbi:MAG TPA: PRC-barrel domain-containing protein [Acidimicrobiia bacterium]|nr:PRC-barrel domain-containing protein [Acidimicrobiia bacterium]
MNDSFRQSSSRRVVSRASAADVGRLGHLLVDAEQRRITAVVVGKGRKARLVDWDEIIGFGPDAVIISDDAAARPPADDHEGAAAHGEFELVGRRVLTDRGTEVGVVDDVTFDPGTGSVLALLVGEREVPAGALLGSGSYAVVINAVAED